MSVSSPKEQTEESSGPLEAIASLEHELAARVAKAQSAASKMVERARGKAASERGQREEHLAEALTAEREEAMVSYRQRSEEMAASWEREADEVRARAEAGVSKATELLLKHVLATPGQEPPP